MRRLPTHRNKRTELIGKSCKELLDLNLSENQTYRSATIGDKLSYLKGIFKWLKSTRQVRDNPFELVTIEVTKKPWAEFTHLDLQLIFNSSLYDTTHSYSKKSTTKASHWWLPICMLFTGARPGELLQLELKDIKKEDGILYADLTDEEETKQLKTKAAKRKVPIHKTILSLGLVEYLKQARKYGHQRLFDGFSIQQRKPSDAGSKWFNGRYRNKYLSDGWKNQKKVLYSFRCTHITEALNKGIDLRLLQQIVGHEPSYMGATKHYDRGSKMKQLKETVDQVNFDNLDLSHLVDGWKHHINK